MNAAILFLICTAALKHGIDPYKAAAVAEIESSLNPSAVGPIGELGLFQLRPKYFAGDLKNPVVNTYTAMKHIAEIKTRCPHTNSLEGGWVLCHNLGVRGAGRIQNPAGQTYYKKFKEAYDRYKDSELFKNSGAGRCERGLMAIQGFNNNGL